MAKRKRVVYRVHYVGRRTYWAVTMVNLAGWKRELGQFDLKSHAIDCAVEEAKARRALTGELTQVVVHNKNGRIAFERTYGKDPARRKG